MNTQVEFPSSVENTENKTFNRLCQIQKLIQKAALKKYVKKI